MNADALHSLQIMGAESHPDSHNQGPRSSGSKEGLSVYGIFHHLARTPQGKHQLRQCFLRPTMDLDVIDERHRSISVFVRPDNANQVKDIGKSLRQVKQMRPVVTKMRRGFATSASKLGSSTPVWSTILKFVFHAIKIRNMLQDVNGAERIAIRHKVIEGFRTFELAQIGQQISDVVDFEQSSLQHRTVVKPGVDGELDNLRRAYDGLDDLLSEVSKSIAVQVQASRDLLRTIYFPQLGFLIASYAGSETASDSYSYRQREGWHLIYTTEDAAYYKTPEMNEMDQQFGDVYTMACDREIEILHALAQSVLQYDELLVSVSDLCGELDCLLALAHGARQYNLVRPKMTRDNVIKVSGGRHILQELCVGSFVANDTVLIGGQGDEATLITTEHDHVQQTRSDDIASRISPSMTIHQAADGPSVLIMTGPNYSGKSIYLKQTAIIVYMAHIGSFVPAERAEVGVTDRILTRISTQESVSKVQSAFMIDLQQISLALNLMTPRSLLIIDEFGKGTDTYDGAGLACGVLEHLLSLEEYCPKTMVAIHFNGKFCNVAVDIMSNAFLEIFENGFLEPSHRLMFGNMEVRVDPEAIEAGDQITYLYNLRLGRSVSSFGTLYVIPLKITSWDHANKNSDVLQ